MKRFSNNDVLISVCELVKYGLSENSVNVSIFNYSKGKSKAWANFIDPSDKRKRLIQFSTIPISTIVKYKLPEVKFLLAQIDIEEKTAKYEAQQKANFFIDAQITEMFNDAIERDAVRYNPIYGKHYANKKKVIAYGIEHAICVACVELNNHQPKFKLKDIHRVYKALPYQWVITDYTRFTIAFKKWQIKGFDLVHPLTGKTANNANAIKMTDFTKARCEDYYKHPNQYTFEMIHKMVSIECGQNKVTPVSLTTIKTYLNKPQIKNRLSYFRNPQHYNRTVAPITRRHNVKQSADLYYGDGSPLQIFCWNKTQTEKIRLNLFAIMDVASGKIVGMDLAESEDRFNVLAALKMAFDLEKIAPFEYKYDNASATKTEEYTALKEAMILKGCLFTPTKKANPQEKSQIERFFNTFQTKYQRMIDGFIGEGIKSKRDNGRINADFLKKVQHKDNLYTYESACKIVAQLISIYNADARRNKLSPNAMFAQSEKTRANKLDATDIALLFWKHKTIKVSKAEIVTTIRHNDYIFDLFEHETNLKLAGKQVKMYYDENDLSSVHLFDLEGKYICECRQKIRVHEGEAGRTPENTLTLIKQSKHNASIVNHIKTQTISVKNKGVASIGGDAEFKLLNPFDVAKDELNGAETDMYNYLIHQKGLDNDKAKDYEPIYEDANNAPNTNKYSKKYKVTNPSLTVITEIE